MAIAVEQTSLRYDSGTGVDTGTITAPTDGRFLVAFLHLKETITVDVVPSGWTLHELSEGSVGQDFDIHVFTKTAGGSEPTTYSWTVSAGDDAVIAFIELSGDSISVDVDIDDDSGGTGVTSQSTGTTAATSKTNELGVAFVANLGDSTGSPSWSNSYTNQADNFDVGFVTTGAIATKALPSTGTTETTLSWTVAGRAHGYLLTVNEAGGVPGAIQIQNI